MENLIIVLVLLAIVGAVVFYLYRAKKHGAKCIGCPNTKQCRGRCSGGCVDTKRDGKTDEK